MSNGSDTPPTGDHSTSHSHNHSHMTNGSDTKFVFPQHAIPISPGLFNSPTFFSACATSGGTPCTPTLLTPAIGISEPYLRASNHIYSPFTLGPPGSLPKTPTLPPPSPHTIVGGAFSLASQGLPTSATFVNSPFRTPGHFMDEISKLGGIHGSPFTIMSPGGVSPMKNNGAAAVFFPTTTITANGVAKVTTLEHGAVYNQSNGVDVLSIDDVRHSHSPVVKIEPNRPPSCCVGDEV